MLRVVCLIVFFPSLVWSQESAGQDNLELFRFLVGSWEGEVRSEGGAGTGQREFSIILKGEFIHIKNRIELESPQTDSSIRLREDWGIMNIDDAQETLVLRQFSDDGSITRYIADSVFGEEDVTVVFVMESIENVPDGTWAKLTITIHDPDRFSELLERGVSGDTSKEWLESHWIRRK